MSYMWGISCNLYSHHKLITIDLKTNHLVRSRLCVLLLSPGPHVWAAGVIWQLDRWLTQVKGVLRRVTSDSAGLQTVRLLCWCDNLALAAAAPPRLLGKSREERVAVKLIVSINICRAFFPEICLNAGFMVLKSPRSFPLTTHHRQRYSTSS